MNWVMDFKDGFIGFINGLSYSFGNIGLLLSQLIKSIIRWTLSMIQMSWSQVGYMTAFIKNIIFSVTGMMKHFLKFVGFIISWGVSILFEPFNLFIKIIEYNVLIFINFWIGLIFNTKLEDVFTMEYGKSQIKVLIQWIRFINVVIITSLFLGILIYYSIVRIIYWLTKIEKRKQGIGKQKEIEVKSGLESRGNINKRSNSFSFPSNLKPNSIFQDLIDEEINTRQKNQDVSDDESINFTIQRDEDYDDVLEYDGLDSLKSNREKNNDDGNKMDSDGNNNDGNNDVNFDSIKTNESIPSESMGTYSTGIFSKLNLTPITTIEEEGEEYK